MRWNPINTTIYGFTLVFCRRAVVFGKIELKIWQWTGRICNPQPYVPHADCDAQTLFTVESISAAGPSSVGWSFCNCQLTFWNRPGHGSKKSIFDSHLRMSEWTTRWFKIVLQCRHSHAAAGDAEWEDIARGQMWRRTITFCDAIAFLVVNLIWLVMGHHIGTKTLAVDIERSMAAETVLCAATMLLQIEFSFSFPASRDQIQ